MQYALFAPIISEPGLDRAGTISFLQWTMKAEGMGINLHNYVTVQWCLVTGEVGLTSSTT